MNIVMCVGDGGEMLFNGRRVSRDEVACGDILKQLKGERLYIKPYSQKLFAPFEGNANLPTVCEDPLGTASDGEWCFIEDEDIMPYFDKIEKLLIYNWNLNYPYDMRLDLDYVRGKLRLSEMKKLVGKAHDKITRELYRKDYRSKI